MQRHYLYCITNNLNGMIYFGARSCKTDIFKDSYMGSGKLIKLAIKKHGKENFTKEIIMILSTREELYELERLVVDQSIVDSQMYYNLKIGGEGGSILGNNLGRICSEETKRKNRQSAAGNTIWRGRAHSEESKRKMSDAQKGRVLSAETRQKMSNAQKLRQKREIERKGES